MLWMCVGEVEIALEKYLCFITMITIFKQLLLIISNDFIVVKEIIIISML